MEVTFPTVVQEGDSLLSKELLYNHKISTIVNHLSVCFSILYG